MGLLGELGGPASESARPPQLAAATLMRMPSAAPPRLPLVRSFDCDSATATMHWCATPGRESPVAAWFGSLPAKVPDFYVPERHQIFGFIGRRAASVLIRMRTWPTTCGILMILHAGACGNETSSVIPSNEAGMGGMLVGNGGNDENPPEDAPMPPASAGRGVAAMDLQISLQRLRGVAHVTFEPSQAAGASLRIAGLTVDAVYDEDGNAIEYVIEGADLRLSLPPSAQPERITVEYAFERRHRARRLAARRAHDGHTVERRAPANRFRIL